MQSLASSQSESQNTYNYNSQYNKHGLFWSTRELNDAGIGNISKSMSQTRSASSSGRSSLHSNTRKHQDFLAWRRLHVSKAKLAGVGEIATFLAGFAVVATVELQINDDADPYLLIAFTVTTALLVCTTMMSIMISTCVLPYITVVSKIGYPDASPDESPHEHMRFFIDLAWALANTISIFLFTLDVILLSWIKYTYFSVTASYCATVIMIPVLLAILIFGIMFYRRIILHQTAIMKLRCEELEELKRQIDLLLRIVSYWESSSNDYQSNMTLLHSDTIEKYKHLKKCAIRERNFYTIYSLTVFFFIIGEAFSEFRFCHREHGPHKIRETACPGGFIAFTPLNVSCMFYAKGADISELTVKFDEDMCDSAKPQILLDRAGETDFSKMPTFHKILFELEDEFAPPTEGIEIHEETCTIECLADWVNPMEPPDEPMLLDKPSISDQEKLQYENEYVARSRELFTALIHNNYFYDDVLDDDPTTHIVDLLENHTDTVNGFQYIIKLLAKSMRITIVQCAPFVENSLYENVLKGMIHLHETNRIHFMVDVDVLGFRAIYEHLDTCEKAVNTRFVMNGTLCEEKHTVDTIVNLDFDSGGPSKYRRESRSFRWGVYDPLIEAAWVAVDFVHGFCFETFHAAEDVLHFHLYIQAMEALFPVDPVQKHWMYPVQLKNGDFWNSMLETEDVQNQMRNLDACAIAAYIRKAPYQERLLRPFIQPEQIENPEYVPYDDAKGKGWKSTVSDYWTWYEKQGSFKELSKSFGYCLDGSPEDLSAVEKDLEETGLNCQSQII